MPVNSLAPQPCDLCVCVRVSVLSRRLLSTSRSLAGDLERTRAEHKEEAASEFGTEIAHLKQVGMRDSSHSQIVHVHTSSARDKGILSVEIDG